MRQEWEKIRGLSFQKKLGYIWDYYKLWIIAVLAVLFVGWYLISSFLRGNRENYLYVEFINTFAEVGQDSEFWEGYVEKVQVDTDQVNVTFDAENYFDMAKDNVSGNHYYEKTVVLADAETLDAIVMEKENLKLFGETGRLLDLNNEKVKQILKKYQDRLITIDYDEDGNSEEIPIGIDLSGSRLTQDAYEECALGIAANAHNIEAIEDFLDYVYEKG